MASRLFQALTRRKRDSGEKEGELSRCLNLVDLTALGVGSTLGLGVYVLAGAVAKTVAGPAVCLSFLVAAIASAVAGLCYAEFAARVPKAGSAYVYSYVSVGEFVAFVIGWNLILECIIGTASVARGLSSYIDALAGKRIQNATLSWAPMNIDFMGSYPDFLSLAFVLLLSGLLSFGVRESSTLNNAFTLLNLTTICIVLVAGSLKADISNWQKTAEEVPAGAGTGGFLPFGVSGVMAGAAKCFYGFVGFDVVATTGEEAKNPQKNIPLAIVISLMIIFSAYFGISVLLTMMWPYYDQDSSAPFPYVFDKVGWPAIKWIVTIGAIFALCTSLLGAMFSLPRVIYSMARDGVIFKPFSKVNSKTQTPLLATLTSGALAGIMSTLFDLDQLIDMMSIGTLLAYTIVAVCVLILRYQVDETKVCPGLEDSNQETSMYDSFKKLFNLNNNKEPSKETSSITNYSIILYSIFTTFFCALVINFQDELFTEAFYCIGFIVSLVGMQIMILIIARQPVVETKLSFKVPLVPIIPCLSVLFNIYLMLELDIQTWIRFVVWLILGFLIYFLYGIRHSVEGIKRDEEKLAMSEKSSKSSCPTKPSINVEKEDTKF